ncbi:bifunctional protein-serine/threonine kinase/phosphatase [Chitinivorax sp. PXF-14]|uniref:protein kinase domain-containing protein n=1 Tax=Chitinivorax sp. PXF-14 TaxID=3230488 RepID=UPI003466CBB2
MTLELAIGSHSETGPKPRNEDALGMVTPSGELLTTKGIALALADGVSGCENGDEAARTVVRGVLSDYYATPETWEIPVALDKLLTALNSWLAAQNGGGQQRFVSTLAVLIARGRRYVLGHVGDTRIYLLRDKALRQLTQDHVWDQPGMHHVLKRAVGLDDAIVVDFSEGELRAGDVFLLATDGVWEPLGELRLHELLELHDDPQRAAEAICQAALVAGGQDNASCQVARVSRLPSEALRDNLALATQLPLPSKLKPGQHCDDFVIESLLHESRATRLYKVSHSPNGKPYVLKTLGPLLASDEEAQTALLTEEWLGKKLAAHYFPQVLPLDNRSSLYYVMSWHAGQTLAARLEAGQHFSAPEVAGIGIRLAKALGVLHRLNILHRDIKLDNLLLTDDDKLKVLDLGVALCPGLTPDATNSNPGTPSYMAPELFNGAGATPQSDLYAAGVSLYRLLTSHYPYGEIEPFQHPRFGEPVPPTRYRPDIPPWLENCLLKAVAREAPARFETAEELLVALERGEHQSVFTHRRTPLIERDPLLTWQAVAGVSIVFNLLLLYILLAR